MSTKFPTFHYKNEKKTGQLAFNITIKTPFTPFYLDRKRKSYEEVKRTKPCRKIVDVINDGEADCVCIKVEALDQLYVTRDYIVTHNTCMQLAWAENVVRKTNGNVLVLCPLAVSHQTCREGEKFGIEAHRSGDGTPQGKITVANYERLEKFDPNDFVGVVADECFPRGTPIDTPNGCVDIETLDKGDKILSAAGVDEVVAVKRRRILHAIRIKTKSHCFISSSDHPFLTERGWIGAQNLRAGDCLVESREAMRLVRQDVSPEVRLSGRDAFLRSILLSEMAHEHSRAQGEGAYAGVCREAGEVSQQVPEVWLRESQAGVGSNRFIESNEKPRYGSEDDQYQNEEWNLQKTSGEARREWNWANGAGATVSVCHQRGMEADVDSNECETTLWNAKSLQGGSWQCEEENCDRSRWTVPLLSEGSGRQEGCVSAINRVESIEVLEQSHPLLDQYRDADGKLYFYDLEVARHPSFSVNGCLVHNCSIIKHWSGATQKSLTRFASKLKYRLLCTATPSPNDYVELGTLSEALGNLSNSQMLETFFRQISDEEKRQRATPDDITHSRRLSWRVLQSFGQWALKPHAFEPFWKWVATWARACRKPSDVGPFDDSPFVLPPLNRRDHIVTPKKAPPGFLFTIPAFGLNQERAERRRTIEERAELVADLTRESDSAIVWCQLNDESDRMEEVIRGAVQVKGSQSMEEKEEKILSFLNGETRVLVTKAKIAGLGLNLQHCAHVVTFVDHSYEKFYQSVRRCYRFGQKRPVTLDVIATEGEINVKKNMDRKELMASAMFDNVVRYMNEATVSVSKKSPRKMELPQWSV